MKGAAAAASIARLDEGKLIDDQDTVIHRTKKWRSGLVMATTTV
jgi:hypothetical protein